MSTVTAAHAAAGGHATETAPEDLVGTKAAAARLRVDARTVVRWCKAGRLPCYRIGNRWRFSEAELERWLVGQRYTPAPAVVPSSLLGVPGQLTFCAPVGV